MTNILGRAPKWLWLSIIAIFAVVSVVFLGVGWYFSSKLLSVTPQKVSYDHAIKNIELDQYVIQGDAYDVDGAMGGMWKDGKSSGVFGLPSSIHPNEKTSKRTLTQVNGKLPEAGDSVALLGTVWASDPKEALGLEFKTVQYDSPLGKMNAWVVPANGSKKWMVGVHGIGAHKYEFLRFVRAVHQSGINFMIIDYRNDEGAPRSSDGFSHLGDTEWQDLEGAVRYVKDQKAEEVQLFGLSFGGSVVENYLRRSTDVEKTNITKVVLDSPALDWDDILSYRLKKDHYPTLLKTPGKVVASWRAGINFDRVSTSNKPESIKHQTLIFHNADDTSVPQEASKKLAEQRSDKVKLVDFGKGGHARAWNHDQQKYEQILKEFISD